jgi:hypothetical protein
VRPGINSWAFSKSVVDVDCSDKCLTIVGSERSISVEVPSAGLAEMMMQRFQVRERPGLDRPSSLRGERPSSLRG